MLNIKNAETLITAVHTAAKILTDDTGNPTTAWQLLASMPDVAKAINMALEKADRADSLELYAEFGSATEWFEDIDNNRYRIILGNFGQFLVESQMYNSEIGTWFGASFFSAPLRSQGAAVSVLARKLMIYPNPSEG